MFQGLVRNIYGTTSLGNENAGLGVDHVSEYILVYSYVYVSCGSLRASPLSTWGRTVYLMKRISLKVINNVLK